MCPGSLTTPDALGAVGSSMSAGTATGIRPQRPHPRRTADIEHRLFTHAAHCRPSTGFCCGLRVRCPDRWLGWAGVPQVLAQLGLGAALGRRWVERYWPTTAHARRSDTMNPPTCMWGPVGVAERS